MALPQAIHMESCTSLKASTVSAVPALSCHTTPQCQETLIPYTYCCMSFKNVFLQVNASFIRLGNFTLLPIT